MVFKHYKRKQTLNQNQRIAIMMSDPTGYSNPAYSLTSSTCAKKRNTCKRWTESDKSCYRESVQQGSTERNSQFFRITGHSSFLGIQNIICALDGQRAEMLAHTSASEWFPINSEIRTRSKIWTTDIIILLSNRIQPACTVPELYSRSQLHS